MENLASYLSDTGITQSAFSKKIGVSDGYLSQILSGVRAPSFKLMLKIENETGMRVPVDAWRAHSSASPEAAE